LPRGREEERPSAWTVDTATAATAVVVRALLSVFIKFCEFRLNPSVLSLGTPKKVRA